MATGINSRINLAANTNTTIASQPASGKAQMLTVSLANRNTSDALIRLAVVNNGTTTPATADYLEYDFTLAANTVYERTGIVLQSGQTIVARSTLASVSAVTYGLEDSVNSNTGSTKLALTAGSWAQATAGPATGRYQVVSLNFLNNTSSVAKIRVCISTAYNSPSTSDYIEYDTFLPKGATMERTGIVIAPGQQIGVYSSVSNVNCVVMKVDDL
jgi:hypothetical protein